MQAKFATRDKGSGATKAVVYLWDTSPVSHKTESGEVLYSGHKCAKILGHITPDVFELIFGKPIHPGKLFILHASAESVSSMVKRKQVAKRREKSGL